DISSAVAEHVTIPVVASNRINMPQALDATGVTMPYRFDTTRGPFLDGACVNDPDHSWVAMHESWNGGVNDNWLPAQAKTRSAAHTPTVMGYYTRQDIPIHYL
ncbi:alkaline phosphatase family protein, partial [Mycobacterium tuberculosis]|uniref:alkaline phosphatase family protein n=1 Tax=Mycobacterium tuberculosis TaxID=1773 RepID=UPI00254FC577